MEEAAKKTIQGFDVCGPSFFNTGSALLIATELASVVLSAKLVRCMRLLYEEAHIIVNAKQGEAEANIHRSFK